MSWAFLLAIIPLVMANLMQQGWAIEKVLIIGLFTFGAVFAINSAVHSYLIVAYADEQGASLDIGFYYMANALGRLVGTILSGWVYQSFGFITCLLISAGFILLASLISLSLPQSHIELLQKGKGA
ncbi:MAG: hypothetical protein GQ529_06080 [Methyloprofundus sp.]|nr:hypothetical protein [Methyloprofundus sp.]